MTYFSPYGHRKYKIELELDFYKSAIKSERNRC